MAKREFTDVTIEICDKELHFKRVTNETLLEFSDKAQEEYDSSVKEFVQTVDALDDKRVSLEKRIALKQKQVDIIESKEDASDDELDKIFNIVEEIERLEDELDTVKTSIVELSKDSPIKEYNKRVDELLGEKVETFLEGISAKEFLKESTPVDTIKAQNLEKYYQLCIVGEKKSKIINEIREDVNRFLESEKEIRG